MRPGYRYFLFIVLSVAFVQFAVGQQRLFVVGGGTRPPDAMKKFVEWSGGEKARLLMITWASGVPEESFAALDKGFQAAGARQVEHAAMPPARRGKACKVH